MQRLFYKSFVRSVLCMLVLFLGVSFLLQEVMTATCHYESSCLLPVVLLWFIFISAASVREIQTPRLLRSCQSIVSGSSFLQEVNDVAICSLALHKHPSQPLPGL